MRITAYKIGFVIPGLTSATAAKVEEALRGLEGVSRVSADLFRARVHVVYAPDRVSRHDLSRAIAAAGIQGFSRC